MTTIIKKLSLLAITLLLGAMSNGAMAAPTYTATVNGTGYDFTYFTGSYSDNIALLQSQPWWGSSARALTFAGTVGDNLGFPIFSSFGPAFAYNTQVVVGAEVLVAVYTASASLNDVDYSGSWQFAVATASVPEIDGALIPQVGLLLAGLFIILGRRKESTATI